MTNIPFGVKSSIERWLTRVAAVGRLCRIHNSLALGLLFLNVNSYYSLLQKASYLKASSWVLLSMFAYAYNDLCDIPIDSINKPGRPIPCGALSSKSASLIVQTIGAVAFVLTMMAWRIEFFLPFCAFTGSIFYSRILRPKSSLWSNIVASLLVVAVPLSAPAALSNYRVWLLSVSIGLLIFSREMHKDIIDLVGDSSFRPTPVLRGENAGIYVRIYPWLLLASVFFLCLAVREGAFTVMSFTALILTLGSIFIAVASFIVDSECHKLQATLTKVASYLIVLILIV